MAALTLMIFGTLSWPWMSVGRCVVACVFIRMECRLMCVVRRMFGEQVYSVTWRKLNTPGTTEEHQR